MGLYTSEQTAKAVIGIYFDKGSKGLFETMTAPSSLRSTVIKADDLKKEFSEKQKKDTKLSALDFLNFVTWCKNYYTVKEG